MINGPKNLGPGPCSCDNKTDPINSATGNSVQVAEDYRGSGPFPLSLKRYYNSDNAVADAHLGAHWRSGFDRSVVVQGDRATVYRADGRQYIFTRSNGTWSPDADVTDRLSEQANGGWTYTTRDRLTERYDSAGRLTAITPLGGPTQTLTHDASGRLTEVTDSLGRTLHFTYDSAERISTFTDPSGGVTAYGYDSHNNLTTVTHPNGTTLEYRYNEPAQTGGANLPHALTGLIDENGNRYATWTFDAKGRATSSLLAGRQPVSVVYNADGTTTITDSLGAVRTYSFTTILGVKKITQEARPAGAGGGTATLKRSYDVNGHLTRLTDWNGSTTTYEYNARGLQTRRTEAVGTPEARTVTTEWHPDFDEPVRITEPGQITEFSYDADGRLLGRTVSATE